MTTFSRTTTFEAVRTWLSNDVPTADYTWFDASTRVINEPTPAGVSRPTGNYFSLQMLGFAQTVSRDVAHTHDHPNDHVRSMVRIQAFGEEAIEALSNALLNLYGESTDTALRAIGYTVESEQEEVSTLDELLDVGSEARGYLDVWVGCTRVGTRVIVEAETIGFEPPEDPQTGEFITSDATFDLTTEDT